MDIESEPSQLYDNADNFKEFSKKVRLLSGISKIEKEKKTPKENNPLNDEQDLTKTKMETIASLEQKLSSNSIKNEVLLQELKNEHALKTGENNLKKYIEGATTPAELEIRKKRFWLSWKN